jgi:Mn-dependent DtxR family transcriptional regulator
MAAAAVDYYEFLQISPHADADTIHRVYRFMAARLHPDNTASGHEENFRLLKAAYDVLSDPKRRAEYDSMRAPAPAKPLATSIDFMDALDGELNRRLAVLAVLYYRRRSNPNFPEVALAEVEERMGFPRDYLDFTLWYLQKKGYVNKEDNAQYALTADGVDFVETQRTSIPTLNKLLTSGSGSSVAETMQMQTVEATASRTNAAAEAGRLAPDYTPIVLTQPAICTQGPRAGKQDRRVGMQDRRVIKVERRSGLREQRTNPPSRHVIN